MINKPYKGGLTREQFLFPEIRITAQLLAGGLNEEEALAKITKENLFQFPTERMIKNLAGVCIRRLKNLNNTELIDALANYPVEVGKQIAMYAMMRDSRLFAEFMVTVIGEKYRTKDMSFSDMDLNIFFIRLQEQNETVAGWADSTIKKIKQVMKKVLVENEYLYSNKAITLNPVLIEQVLEIAIRNNNDEWMLPAFNCFD